MLFFLPFICFLGASHAKLQEFYSEDLTCSGKPTVKFASNGDCSGPTDSGPSCFNFINITGTTTSCPGAVILPPDWASLQVWASSATCSGIPDFIIAIPANTCSGYWELPTIALDCATSSIRDCTYNVPNCDGCPSQPADSSGNCAVGNPTLGDSFPIQSYVYTCPIVCSSAGSGGGDLSSSGTNLTSHNAGSGGGDLSSSGTNLTSHNAGSGGHATMESGQVSSGTTIIFSMFVVLLFVF
jgi:hypothetical protein